jgi:hypothetical protein
MKLSGFKQKKTKPMARTGFKQPTRAKKPRSKPVKRKRRVKTPLQKAKDTLWEHCKRIVRARYVDDIGTWNCYSCGSYIPEPRKAQTGHFIASSICSVHLRYSLENLRIQCYNCNINKSGNWIGYEKHLKADGIDVEAIKQLNEDTKNESYRLDWYEAKIKEYETKIK